MKVKIAGGSLEKKYKCGVCDFRAATHGWIVRHCNNVHTEMATVPKVRIKKDSFIIQSHTINVSAYQIESTCQICDRRQSCHPILPLLQRLHLQLPLRPRRQRPPGQGA